MTKFKITKQTVTAPARKLKGTWTVDAVGDLKELELWMMVRQARSDYYDLIRDVVEFNFTEQDFAYYMEQNWGIKVHTGPRLSDHTIVDEQKYTMFVLKYAGQS
jgi:hypothetical protein